MQKHSKVFCLGRCERGALELSRCDIHKVGVAAALQDSAGVRRGSSPGGTRRKSGHFVEVDEMKFTRRPALHCCQHGNFVAIFSEYSDLSSGLFLFFKKATGKSSMRTAGKKTKTKTKKLQKGLRRLVLCFKCYVSNGCSVLIY